MLVLEAEQVPALAHMRRQRRADVDRALAARMRQHDPPRQQVQLVLDAAGQFQFWMLKYLGSPTIGWPIWVVCARSWCVRPVTGLSDSQASFCAALSTTA